MKYTKHFIIALFLISASLLTASKFFPGPDKRALVLTGVNVIPMDKEQLLSNQTVIIEEGKITYLGNGTKIKMPEGALVVDGKGKYLVPGFFDMHAHFFYEQGNNVNTCKEELTVMLANGLTSARIQCGDSLYLEARKKVKEGEWPGPELRVSSPQFVGAWPWPGKIFAEICKTPREAEEAVIRSKKKGYDEIKITFMVKRDVYDAIVKTAKELGIPVTGHVGPLVGLAAALRAGEQIEHMDEFIDQLLPDTSYNHGQSVSDMNIWRKNAWATVPYLQEDRIQALVKRVKEAGISVTPTNFFFFSSFADSLAREDYVRRPDFAYIPSKIKEERWQVRTAYWRKAPSPDKRKKYLDLRKGITYQLWKAGVPLMAGSDSPEWFLVQGFSIHDELQTFTEAGLSPYAALETATKNPATYTGQIRWKGTIEAGKEADLILLNKNPLEQIANTRSIYAVILKGRIYNRQELDDMLSQAREVLGN